MYHTPNRIIPNAQFNEIDKMKRRVFVHENGLCMPQKNQYDDSCTLDCDNWYENQVKRFNNIHFTNEQWTWHISFSLRFVHSISIQLYLSLFHLSSLFHFYVNFCVFILRFSFTFVTSFHLYRFEMHWQQL